MLCGHKENFRKLVQNSRNINVGADVNIDSCGAAQRGGGSKHSDPHEHVAAVEMHSSVAALCWRGTCGPVHQRVHSAT